MNSARSGSPAGPVVLSLQQDDPLARQLLTAIGEGANGVILEVGGKQLAVVLTAKEFQRLARLDAQRAAEIEALDRARAGFAGVSQEELDQEATAALNEARNDRRRELGLPPLP